MLTVGQIRKAAEGLGDDAPINVVLFGDVDLNCDYEPMMASRFIVGDGVVIQVQATDENFFDDDEFFERDQADEEDDLGDELEGHVDDHEIDPALDARLMAMLDCVM